LERAHVELTGRGVGLLLLAVLTGNVTQTFVLVCARRDLSLGKGDVETEGGEKDAPHEPHDGTHKSSIQQEMSQR